MQLVKRYDCLIDHHWQASVQGGGTTARTVQFRRQLQTVQSEDVRNFSGDCSQGYLMQQYKLYVEIADRMIARRMLINAFFVGLNLLVIAVFSLAFNAKNLNHSLWEFLPFLGVCASCVVWWKITALYRRLTFGRSRAIQKLEQRLPVTPYETEWSLRGNRKASSLYKSLAQIEYWLPLCFILSYGMVATSLYLG